MGKRSSHLQNSPRYRIRRVVAVFCLALIAIAVVGMVVALGRPWAAASAVREDLAALEGVAEAGPQAFDVEGAIGLLHTTRADLEALEAAARPFLWLAPHLGWLPRYGPDIEAVPVLLEIALDVTAAGEAMIEPLAPLLDRAADHSASGEADLLQEASATLAAARPQLLAARSAIERTQAAREGLEVDGLSSRVRGWVDRLDRYLPLFERGVEGALFLPELLGAEGPRVYLILVQNEDELRATGGFISGVARVTVDGGGLSEVQFVDSYAVDDFSQPYPEPPAPLHEYMLADLWLFRDSNWSPDFPTSARTAIALYATGRGVQADGVIALDQQAIRLLVGALAPLEVEGCPEPVTAENVIQMAQQAWEPGEETSGDWWKHRKDFMAALLEAVLHRLKEEPERIDLVRLARAMLQALEWKDVLVYLQDEEAAALLADLGWDGALRHGPGDSLMVVDTNMGFNKVNALVEESLEYVVDLTDLSHPGAILIVRHRHPLENWEAPCRQEPRYDPTYEQMTQRCYWDYLRVYVPSGAQVVDATPHPVSGLELLSGQDSPGQVTVGPPEHGHDVLATFLLLRPGEDVETRFEYVLPGDVLQRWEGGTEYLLVVQKQPGAGAIALRVLILLPPGVEVETSEPEPSSATGAELEYALTLETDQVLRVILRCSQ